MAHSVYIVHETMIIHRKCRDYPVIFYYSIMSASRRLLVVPWYRLSMLDRRAVFVADLFPDILRNPDIGKDSFKRLFKVHLFSTWWSLQRII